MKAISGKRMAKLAESKGWLLTRTNGSHHIYTLHGRMERVVIPFTEINALRWEYNELS